MTSPKELTGNSIEDSAKKSTRESFQFKFKETIIALVAIGAFFIVLAEIPQLSGNPFHISTIIAHFGVAFIVAGLVTLALEMPHNKDYIKKVLSDIVIKRDFLSTLNPAQLMILRRDCDLARLNFPHEETEGNFTKEVEKSFYKYVSEDTWTSLITSNYRTNYTQSTIFSDKNCPDGRCPNGFWTKTVTTKYTLYTGIPLKGEQEHKLILNKKLYFFIDHNLLQEQASSPHSSKTCDLTGAHCCFTGCGEHDRDVPRGCLFMSDFQLNIDDQAYSLDLKNKIFAPVTTKELIKLKKSTFEPEPIPITITPQLDKGTVTMEINYEIDKKEAEIKMMESTLVKKKDEISSIKMNIPTRDAVFIFNFPEGIVTDSIYFGFREVDPFSDRGTNNVYARVPSWMFPGDGIAVSWWVPPIAGSAMDGRVSNPTPKTA